MPRPAGHLGRSTYPETITEAWAKYAASAVELRFNCHALIALPGAIGEYDEATHTRAASADSILYDGPALLQSLGAPAGVEIAGQVVTTDTYQLALTRDAALIPPDRSVLITSPDPQLSGLRFTVTGHVVDSVRIVTNLLIELNQG